MAGLKQSKRVSWPTDGNLCKVKFHAISVLFVRVIFLRENLIPEEFIDPSDLRSASILPIFVPHLLDPFSFFVIRFE